MLTNAVIGDSQITVRPADDDQSYNDDSDDCDIQASKPKAAIFAEILAAGYTLQDAILEKGIEFDSKYGFSNYFKQYLAQIQANRTFDFGTILVDFLYYKCLMNFCSNLLFFFISFSFFLYFSSQKFRSTLQSYRDRNYPRNRY